MPRKGKGSKGILGVPKRAGTQVFAFGRHAEPLPSDESDDPDFIPEEDETSTNAASTSRNVKTKRNKEEGHASKKKKLEKRKKADPKKKDKKGAESKSNPPVQLSKGWSELIPVELLMIIFQHAMKQIIGSKIPFLCRMSRVCRHWRQVASEPRLWRTVNLSTSYVKISASPSILQQLAPERLKYVRQLFLGGWSKLTDKGIEAIGQHCNELQTIGLSECESLTPRGITSLVTKCCHLTSIDVKSTNIDINCLKHIVKQLGSQLETLWLANCCRVTGTHILPVIQENCPNLIDLDVSGTNIRKIHIEKLQAGCPKLRRLMLANLLLNSIPKTNEKSANGFPDLEVVDLSCDYYGLDRRNDQLLYRILWASKDLRMLILEGPNLITAEGFRNLPDFPLKILIYNNASYSKVAAIVEKWHHCLESLDLSSNRGVDDECMKLLSNFGMQKLKSLNLSNTIITSDGVRNVINGCPNLNDLNISSCRGLPRGVRNHHGELGIRSLPWRIAEEETSD
ncbi:unnamed protein product [Porites evermanni]|uniref:F-box domain-containing protein n=1 Tax=Porites evermanni TaxID=104178 RepID=A0ABN8N0A3_9CNID|nr:unnamed protein product [Porites evermanni]